MTPSNPSNSQPLIYRIMDALGVTHLVACINHTHDQSEVEGLTAALAGKLAKLTSFTAGNFVKVKSDGTLEDSGKKASDFADAADTATALAGKQATLTFDSTPTANSTNPVTSGGVKAALDGKANASHGHNSITGTNAEVACEQGEVNIGAQDEINLSFGDLNKATLTPQNIANLKRAITNPDGTPTANSDNLVTSGGVKAALDEFININAQTDPLIPTSRFVAGKKYQITVTNPVEKWVHQYFTKGEAASERIDIIGNKVVTSQSDFGMLVWRDYESDRLHVIYQGEFEDQGLDY